MLKAVPCTPRIYINMTTEKEIKRFPILKPPKGCTDWVPWDAIDEKWAMKIHGQSVERLAQRGGLTPDEIFINRHKLNYFAKVFDAEAIALCNELVSNQPT